MEETMDKVFNPASIAIIGASETPGKAAERRTRSLLDGGYQGRVFLVNPKRSELFGRKTYPSLLDVGQEVDLVMVVVAPRLVSSAVAESIKAGAKGVIIITAGLGETGEAGKKIEAEIVAEAAKTGAYIIGPNCSGLFNASSRINLLGVPHIQEGGLSVIAQSGNVIDSLTHYAKARGWGFRKIISMGNAVGVNLHEYIDYLRNDDQTRVILAYLESIKDGPNFIRSARETVKKKPVIVLKAGKSKAGVRAAASHTGSLAGDDAVVEAAFKQVGVIRVSNVDELFDVADVLANCPLPKGRRIVVLSEGGGDNAIAADNIESYGLEVPVLSSDTQKKLKPFLLEGMPSVNPIDYGGTAEENPLMINECLKVCLEDEEIDAAFITGFFGGFKDIIAARVAELENQAAGEMVALVGRYQKPLIVHTSFARDDVASLNILKSAGVPVIESSERAARCLAALVKYSDYRQKSHTVHFYEPIINERPFIKEILKKAGGRQRANLLETQARQILEEYRMPLNEAVPAHTPEEAKAAADKIGYPVAMKVLSPDIIHKSDLGGIKLDLRDEAQLAAAFEEILAGALRATSRDRVEGVLVSPMVVGGQECIVGMVRDRQFGPVIMFGLGGVFVEVLKDVSFRVAPLTEEDIEEMVRETKGYKILTGLRRQPPKDVRALKEVIAKVARIALENPEIKELDLNPVVILEKGAKIIDARIILASPED